MQKRPIILRSLLIQCLSPFLSNTHLPYGVALVSRIDEITGLFCKRALYKQRYSAKETYNFIDPTDCSHPLADPISDLEISIMRKSIGLFCKRALKSIGLFCKRARQAEPALHHDTSVTHLSSICNMGWLRLVGSLKV